MRKPDKEVWNRQTLFAVVVECMIMLNIDVYGSSYTLWMKLQGQASVITLAATIVTVTSFFGYALVGVLIDRFGTKAVQLVALHFLLIAGIGVAVTDGWYALSWQILRFFLCGVLMVANDTQVRGLLPEGKKKMSGVGKLKSIGTLVSIIGVLTGSVMVSEHRDLWNWLGPIAAAIGIIFLLISKQSNHVPERASIFPHKEVFQLTCPVIGIAVCANVLVTYIVIDLGVRDGSLVRTVTYIGASLSGWLLAYLVKRHRFDNCLANHRGGIQWSFQPDSGRESL
jgi:MFS family permease